MEAKGHPESSGRSRREFVADAVMSVGALVGLGGLAFRFLQYLYPVVPPVKLVEVFASKEADIPPDGVRFVNLPQGPVMLERSGGQVRALSAICTHLGCIIHWHPDRKEFVCPCHGGVYARDGHVVSGPPPRPLEKLEVQMRSERVFVLMKAQKEEQV
jgi:cytochrome b6-f complex iron-sulfur subunit